MKMKQTSHNILPCEVVTQMIPTLQMKEQLRNLPKIPHLGSHCLVIFLIVTTRKRECYWHLELRDDAKRPTGHRNHNYLAPQMLWRLRNPV